jgi:hypothetical protein
VWLTIISGSSGRRPRFVYISCAEPYSCPTEPYGVPARVDQLRELQGPHKAAMHHRTVNDRHESAADCWGQQPPARKPDNSSGIQQCTAAQGL